MGKALSAGLVPVAYTRPLKFWKGKQPIFMLSDSAIMKVYRHWNAFSFKVIVPLLQGDGREAAGGAHGVVWQQARSALVRSFAAPSLLTLDYSERSAWTVLIRAARTAGTNDAKIAEATMTAADPINGSSPGSWSAGT